MRRHEERLNGTRIYPREAVIVDRMRNHSLDLKFGRREARGDKLDFGFPSSLFLGCLDFYYPGNSQQARELVEKRTCCDKPATSVPLAQLTAPRGSYHSHQQRELPHPSSQRCPSSSVTTAMSTSLTTRCRCEKHITAVAII